MKICKEVNDVPLQSVLAHYKIKSGATVVPLLIFFYRNVIL